MTIMIALVGGQVLPNFLLVRHYHPSDVLLVHTKTMPRPYEMLNATLQKEVRVHEVETDPFSVLAIAEELENKLKDLMKKEEQPLEFNLTGGTKAMVLAAYQVAQRREAPIMYLESEKKGTHVFRYGWKQQELQPVSDEWLPELVTLKDIFDLHFGPGTWTENGVDNTSIGGRFEAVLADILRDNGYQVMVGTRNGPIEIDVAVRFGNQYGIIEAKMGKGGRGFKGAQQLSTTVRLLGTYSKTFYAITTESEKSQESIMEALNIQVIPLLGYDAGTNTLPSEGTARLLASIDKALKV
jgi:hypothetical protein